MAVTKGGYNNSSPFALKDDHTAIYEVESSTLLPASTPVAATTANDAILVLNQKLSTAVAYDANRLPAVTVDTDQYEEAVLKFCDVYATVGAGGGGGGGNYENGAPEIGVAADGSGASNRDVLVIHYGPKMSDGKVEVLLTVNSVDPTSASTTWADGAKNKPTVKFNAAKAKNAISVPATMFDATIVTQPGAPVVIAKGQTFKRVFLTAS